MFCLILFTLCGLSLVLFTLSILFGLLLLQFCQVCLSLLCQLICLNRTCRSSSIHHHHIPHITCRIPILRPEIANTFFPQTQISHQPLTRHHIILPEDLHHPLHSHPLPRHHIYCICIHPISIFQLSPFHYCFNSSLVPFTQILLDPFYYLFRYHVCFCFCFLHTRICGVWAYMHTEKVAAKVQKKSHICKYIWEKLSKMLIL